MPADWTTVPCDTELATRNLGQALAATLRLGATVALHGTLGAGKTVFAKGVALGLGIAEPVTSPTFTVVQEYRRADGSWLFHLDMYRIDDELAALQFGIEEYLFTPDGISVVEWPERIAGLLTPAALGAEPSQFVPVYIDRTDRGRRVRLPVPPGASDGWAAPGDGGPAE